MTAVSLARKFAASGPDCLLLVEDDEGLVELFRSQLADQGLSFHSERTGRAALDWLTTQPDCLMLLDYSLPDMTAKELIAAAAQQGGVPPFIVITGQGDERIAVEMMKLGASDYVIKDTTLLDRLPAVVERALREIQNQRRLAASERKFEAIFEGTEDAILLLDEQGLIDGNGCALSLFGIEHKSQLRELSLPDLSPAVQPDGRDSRAVIQEWIAAALQGFTRRFEWTHRRRDGREFPAEVLLSPFELEGRTVLQAAVRDITERRRMEEVQIFLAQTSSGTTAEPFFNVLARYLAQSLDMDSVRIDRLVEDGSKARTVAVWRDGHFEDNVTYALEDTPCGEILRKTICCYPASVCQYFPRDRVLQDLRAESYVGVTLRGHAGNPIGLITVIGRRVLANRAVVEATLKLVAVRATGELERQQAEEHLRESERRLSTLMANLPGMAYRCANHPEWPMTFVSEGCEELTGWSSTALMRNQPAYVELIVPEDRERVWKGVKAAVAAGQPFELNYRITTAQGQVRWVWERGQGVPGNGGELQFLEGFIADVTARKQAEEEIERSHVRYRRAIEAADAIPYQKDYGSDTYVFMGQGIQELTGYAATELRSHVWKAMVLETVLRGDAVGLTPKEAGRRAVAGELKHWSADHRIRCKDGQVRWISDASISIFDEQGNYAGSMGILQDITERKQAEAAILARERYLHTILQTTVDGFWVVNREGVLCEVNEAYCAMSGFTREESLGQRISQIDALETAEDTAARMQRIITKGFEVFETAHRRKDGRLLPVEVSVSYLPDHGGQFICFSRDLTRRKRQEQRISLLGWMLDAAPASITVHDTQGRFYYANQEAVAQHGYASETEFLALNLHQLDVPESAASLEERFRRIAAEGEARFEVEHYRKDGSRFPLEVLAKTIEWEDAPALLSVATDITERKRAEAELLHYQAQLEAIYDSAPLMMCLMNDKRELERMNRAMADFAGRALPTNGEAGGPGDFLGCLNALDDPKGCGAGPGCVTCPLRLSLLETMRTGQPQRNVETTLFLARNGARREVRLSASTASVRVADKTKLLLCLEDITIRRQLEQQFLQAQKMEAVGQLAGGVAHDFNNILAAVMMHLGLLAMNLELDAENRQLVKELETEIKRAANLTRQLLMFSRRSVLQVRPVNLSAVVENLLKMLGRLLGEHIEMRFAPALEEQWVDADPGMLEQVVVNLCVNARDAMPKGGVLTLTTESLQITEAETVGHPDRRTGGFVCLSVADTGCGMDEATLKRAFEPFFTTKEMGKGTGLGLATVYGIVSQHKGWIEVASALGNGSTFRIFLPALTTRVAVENATTAAPLRRGHETILLVEDEPAVRRSSALCLRALGYRVLEAATGNEALGVWGRLGGQIDLLLTDMVMPAGMTGLELVAKLREKRASLRAILTSGYSAEMAQHGLGAQSNIVYLPKPYEMSSLAAAVRKCLDLPPS